MKLQPYPVYKDSGVAWLGKVPEHWQMQRGKWLFRKMDRPVRDQDEVVTCFRDGTVTLRRNRRTRGFTESLKEIGYQGIRKGDLVIHAMDGFAGAIGVSDSDGKGSPVYAVCRPEDGVNSYFYAYLLREMARTQWIMALAKGIRERSTDFRFTTFAGQDFPFPPLSEQAYIVRFLNQADRRIQRYILAKSKFIALLNEQKQTIIHRAVTGQFDVYTGLPYSVYKSSVMTGLSNVPEHWKVAPLCSIAKPRKITNEEHRELLSVYLGRGVIPFTAAEEKRTNPTSEDLSKYQLVEPGDFVLNNQQAWRGSVGVSRYWGIVSPAYLVLALDKQLDQEFADKLLSDKIMVAQYLVCSKGVGSIQRNLYWPHLKRVSVIIPPITEQEAIVRFLEEATASLARVIEQTSREIDLIREYRTRLISDVITGKLDVREAVSGLSDELGEPDLIHEVDEITDVDSDEISDFEEALEEVVI